MHNQSMNGIEKCGNNSSNKRFSKRGVYMLLFLCFIGIIIFINIIIIFSEIHFAISNLEFTNIKEILCEPNNIKIQLLFLGKVKWSSFNIKKFKLSPKVKLKYKQSLKRNSPDVKIFLELIKSIRIKKFNCNIAIDLENVEILAYITAIISTIIANVINQNDKESINYKVVPLFNNTNSYYLSLNCIFSIKIVHIINMLKLEKRRGVHERTSNRRFNANCNGKHKEYDRC